MEKIPFRETRVILESHNSAPPAVSGYTYGEMIYCRYTPVDTEVYRIHVATAGAGAGLWYWEPMTVY